jgi:hypothetical protein
MIEHFIENLINELGATGLLVIGLYFLLFRPLTAMAKHLRMINHELGEILQLLHDRKHDRAPKRNLQEIDIGA